MRLFRQLVLLLLLTTGSRAQSKQQGHIINIIFTSDAHYGINRKDFRGDTAASGHTVNRAMIREMNQLPGIRLPRDQGINSGNETGPIDYLIQGGDVANRMEIPIPSAAISWRQFQSDYIHTLKLKNHLGQKTTLLLIPGNHDLSNALGFYRPMKPITDPAPMVGIYNLMMHPTKPLTKACYNYARDKVNYSKNIGGIHFIFITLWPDSSERKWMEKDLAKVSLRTPVVLFTHDEPESEAKHFSNPNKKRGINATDKFENLLAEIYKEGPTILADSGKTTMEQQGWVDFIAKHPNIKAYFHGNSNWNQFYTYHGPDSTVSLPTFRVDSPMKGKFSGTDEKRLSFQVITIDTKTRYMTVRECLWNTDPSDPARSIKWGDSQTIAL